MVAEHMLLQILGVLKRVREAMEITAEAADWGRAAQRTDEDHFAYNWSKRSGLGTLSGATTGILGFGEVGLELALRLRGFDCRLLYNKRSRLPGHVEEQYGLHLVAPDELAERSDIVCSLLPYQGVHEPIDAAFFARMKRGAYLVHCGSGAVVEEAALIAALRTGQIAGAALDTYTYEPLRPDDPLVELARDPMINLILTPHVAGGGVNIGDRGRAQDYDNIMAMVKGEPLQHRVL